MPFPKVWFHCGAVLAVICCLVETVALSQSTQENAAFQVTLRSHHFATPLTLEDDPLKRKITSIELRLPKLSDKPVEGNIRLDESKVSFDDFGDGDVARREGDMSLAVKLEPLSTEDKSEPGRRLYSVQLLDERFTPEMHLVYSSDPLYRSRLLVRTDRMDAGSRERKLLRVLPLIDVDQAPPERESDALGSAFLLRTPHLRNRGDDTRSLPAGYYQIHGELGGNVLLTHDNNIVECNALGDPISSTLVGHTGIPFKSRKLPIDDPSGAGRLVWDLIPDTQRNALAINIRAKDDPTEVKPRYRLVLSPHAVGPHRLIVYMKESVRYVLPLNNSSWERLQLKRRELARTPVREREAIEEILRLVGNAFRFEVKADHVASLSFSGRSATRETIAQLPRLPHLKRLRFGRCRDLSEGDLRPLERLKSLESLSFSTTPVSDASLKHLRNMENLRYLRLYDVVQRGETRIIAPQPTDKGLAELAGLARLESLHLYGEKITDGGLTHLRSLVGLRQLYLNQTSTTVTGLVEFSSHRPDVRIRSEYFEFDPSQKSVVLNGAKISDNSLKALTKLPVVRQLNCDHVDNISADGMKHLATLAKLESLRLSHCRIVNATLAPLQTMKNLKSLDLWYCRSIGDEGVAHLHKLNIQQLHLTGTRVTAGGLARLKAELPNCDIKKER